MVEDEMGGWRSLCDGHKSKLRFSKYMPTRRAGKLFILSELQILPVSLRKIWQTA